MNFLSANKVTCCFVIFAILKLNLIGQNETLSKPVVSSSEVLRAILEKLKKDIPDLKKKMASAKVGISSKENYETVNPVAEEPAEMKSKTQPAELFKRRELSISAQAVEKKQSLQENTQRLEELRRTLQSIRAEMKPAREVESSPSTIKQPQDVVEPKVLIPEVPPTVELAEDEPVVEKHIESGGTRENFINENPRSDQNAEFESNRRTAELLKQRELSISTQAAERKQTLQENTKKLEELRRSLQSIREEMRPAREAVSRISTVKQEEDPNPKSQEAQNTEFPQISEDELGDKVISEPRLKPRLGFYLLPGFVSQIGDGMKWKSALGEDYPMDESFGLGASGRLGHRWENFFTELHLSYVKSDIQKIDFGALPVRSSGEIDQIAYNLNFGAYLPMGQDFLFEAGLGLGVLTQDMHVRISDLDVLEDDTVFAPQVFLGFNYCPNDEFFFNCRYRFSVITKMDNFTRRNLHLLETSFGWML